MTLAHFDLKIGGVRKRWRRIALIAAVIGVAWLSAAVALDRYGRGRTPSGYYDVIIVAGARVQHGGEPSGSLERRAHRAAELFKEGVAPHVLLTGGIIGDRPSEASVAASLVRGVGVPESALLLEEDSTTTWENARFAHALLGSRRALVVTDTYHVLRAQLIFEKYFPNVRVIGVAHRPWPQVRHALREVGAMLVFAASEPFRT